MRIVGTFKDGKTSDFRNKSELKLNYAYRVFTKSGANRNFASCANSALNTSFSIGESEFKYLPRESAILNTAVNNYTNFKIIKSRKCYTII